MIITVILAGGFGKRLWPLSTQETPKQFIKLIDKKSMFQHAVENALKISNNPIIIVANIKHYDLIISQLKIYGSHDIHILFENKSYNTTTAISVAALYIKNKFNNPYILILPSDHYIKDITPLKREIDKLYYIHIKHINLFGITPNKADSNYGYIKKGYKVFYKPNLYRVDNFIEKPQIDLAKTLCNSDQYLWNIGIIFASNNILLQEIKKYNQSLIQFARNLLNNITSISKNKLLLNNITIDLRLNFSIDHLIFEKATNIYVSYLKLDWRDLGSWHVFRNFIKQYVKHQLLNEHYNISVKPWGYYQTIAEDSNFKIKILKINLFQRISLQSHKHRNETWIILEGQAKLVLGDKIVLAKQDSIIHISKNMKHRIENIGNRYLTILELQTGNILDEDDIIRWEDDYVRADSKIVA